MFLLLQIASYFPPHIWTWLRYARRLTEEALTWIGGTGSKPAWMEFFHL